jgi:hypothetical protein
VKGLARGIVEIEAIDQYSTAGWQIKFLKQGDDGCLAAAGVTDEGDGLAGFGYERDVCQNGTAFLIFEMDILEFNSALNG